MSQTSMPATPSSSAGRDFGITLAIIIVVAVVSAFTQAPVSYHNGEGWDGVDYCAMARNFAHGERPTARAPFVNRVAAPWLASVVYPSDPVRGFWVSSLILSALTVLLLMWWLRLHLCDWRVRALMIMLYCITFFNPPRGLHYYAATTDTITHFFLIIGFLLLFYLDNASLGRAVMTMCVFVVIAITAREFMLIFAAALLLRGNPLEFDLRKPSILRIKSLPSPLLLVPIVLGLVTYAAIRSWVISLPSPYEFPGHIGFMIYNKSAVPYLHGWYVAYGPVLVLLVWKAKECWDWLMQRQSILAMFLVVAVLGWIAGTDTERFLAWGFPIILVLIGRVIEDHQAVFRSLLLVSTFILLQGVSQRLFQTMPDSPHKEVGMQIPVLTIIGRGVEVMNLYSWHADRRLAMVSFLEYIGITLILVVWLRAREQELYQAQNRAVAHGR